MLKNIAPPIKIERVSDRAWLSLLLFVGILTHYFVWPLSEPRSLVFDEGGYGPLVSTYVSDRTHSFDIHPPHAKMVTAALGWLVGYRQKYETGENGAYSADFPIVALRFVPSFCGVLIPLLFFWLARLAGVKGIAAPLAALGLALDNALTVHTRLLGVDGLLLVAALGAFIAYLRSCFLTAGLLAGLALGTKFTGLSVGAFLLVMYLVKERSPKRAALFSLGWIGVYLGGWWLHFQLTGLTGDFWPRLVSHHQEIFAHNRGLNLWHFSSSHWWSWPVGGKAIWLFFQNPQYPDIRLCEVGNPALWLGTLALFLCALVATLRREQTGTWPWIAAYLASYLPFALIGRYMFLYHYFLPFVLSLLVGALWLDGRLSPRRFWDGVVALVLGFLLLSPLTYSFPVPAEVRLALFDHLPHFW